MKAYILLLELFLSLLPLSTELGIEVYRTKVLGRRDKHALSFGIRLVVQLVIAWCMAKTLGVPVWKSLLLYWSVFYWGFNYMFNKYALDTHPYYLGNNLWDKLQKKFNPKLLLWVKIGFVVGSIITFFL
jgi:hypothetical protein